MLHRKDFDASRARWCLNFIGAIRDLLVHEKLPGIDDFNVTMATLLQEMLAEKQEAGAFGGVFWSLRDNCAAMGLKRWVVTRMLKHLARAGVIKCVISTNKTDGRRRPLEVVINPEIAKAYGRTDVNTAKRFGRACGETWLQRFDYPNNVQGFGDEVIAWGLFRATRVSSEKSSEPAIEEAIPAEENKPEESSLVRRLREAGQGGIETAKARKQREAMEFASLCDDFVGGCASVWSYYQEKMGLGGLPPAWSGPRAKLPAAIKRERAELEKIFGLYGGEVASIHWMFYVACTPIAKGNKLEFLPNQAYRQWVGSDKKPSSFSKHFNLIANDVKFAGWLDKAGVRAKMADRFGKAFDMPPRDPGFLKSSRRGRDGVSAAAATKTGGSAGVADGSEAFGLPPEAGAEGRDPPEAMPFLPS